MDLQAPSEESIVKVAVTHLVGRLPAVERSRIESTIRRVVHDWYSRARIKLFVGIIAERHARTELQRPQAEATTQNGTVALSRTGSSWDRVSSGRVRR